MNYGILEEPRAKGIYSAVSVNNVKETGMWINTNCQFLGASPDGLVIENDIPTGVLEIKCLKVFKTSSISDFIDMVKQKKISSTILGRQCFVIRDGKLFL